MDDIIAAMDLPSQMCAAADILDTVNLRTGKHMDAHSPAELRRLAAEFEAEDAAKEQRDNLIQAMALDIMTARKHTIGPGSFNREIATLLIDYGWKRDNT